MKLEIHDLKRDVSVKCDIGAMPIKGTYKEIGYFKVFGEYKSGSIGSDDASHICGMMAYAQERFYHSHWVLDLSELHYKWGDEMDMVVDFGRYEGIDNVAIVYGPYCDRVSCNIRWHGSKTR